MQGSIQKRGINWRIRYDGPPDATGKRRQVSETVKGAKKDADRVLRDRLAAIENGGYIPRNKETVGEFMRQWLDTYAATNCGPKTQQGYRYLLTHYVEPFIGQIPLQSLTPRHIQSMYTSLLERGLGARTVKHCHTVLKQSLSHAIRWGILVHNPADATTSPRPLRREMGIWDAETIHEFLEAAKSNRFYYLYHLAILTGMRRAELAGLKWDSVDLSEGKLSVTRTLQRIKGKGLVEGQPKTAKSRRLIALGPNAVSLLHEARGRQIEYRLQAGSLWQNTGYVFTQPDGRPVDPEWTSKDFACIVRTANLPHTTLHGLRHAHATLLLTAGVHPKVVQERLGHSGISITLDIYSHVVQGMQEAAALALDARLAQTDAV